MKSLTSTIFSFAAGLAPMKMDKALLGSKGVGLAEMASIGLPVPPGFIISTEACNEFRKNKRTLSSSFRSSVLDALADLEKQTKLQFGGMDNPLLVSVRSGARVSMPGMMDTILDLGLNDETVQAFGKKTNNEYLAYDCYRRLIMMFASTVKGINRKHFEIVFENIGKEEKANREAVLSIKGLKRACELFKKIYSENVGKEFPQDVEEQLFESIIAVFNSWDSERACLYRQINQIPDEWGTAVIVQVMVFGNKNQRSATGVGFTRDPATGENMFYGEFLINAQGEEVVAGIRTPHPINKYQKAITKSSLESLEELMPKVYQELHDAVLKLESYYKDMQDIEFTIDDGQLFMLQTRTGKRTGFGAIKMAVDMLDAHLIDEKTALKRVHPFQLVQLLAPIFDPKSKIQAKDKLVAKGLNAGPGAASGKAVFSTEQAVQYKQKGIRCILVRDEASPDDFPGLVAAEGILTIRGGSTSHAAVVARGMGKPCIVGCSELYLDEKKGVLFVKDKMLKEGDFLSIDGQTGEVYFCELPTIPSEVVSVLLHKTLKPEESSLYQRFKRIMDLADKYRRLKIRANADSPKDCLAARAFGAEGVGLCRTEHMFMDVDRLNDVRCLFFSTSEKEQKEAVARLLPYQKKDFTGIFRAMNGLPVTIRLLDPPLHEFMPHTEEEMELLAKSMKVPKEKLMEIRDSLHENNPMLGHRGCRLGIVYPGLTAMQARAIFEAAVEVVKEGGDVKLEIMVPLVGIALELTHQKAIIDITAKEVFQEKGHAISYSVGTMIELPRAALLADKIAKEAEFFSFGTNDLTQTTFGISRDDSAKFVPNYIKGVPNPWNSQELMHILSVDPFHVIDEEGVGELMRIALKKGKQSRSNLKSGICGEHGGEEKSVIFCHGLGLDYVSCSPYRLSVAKLAAALAAIQS